MRSWLRVWIALICFSTTALPGEPQDSRPAGDKTKANSDWNELKASMEKMHTAIASVEPSGQSDVDFVRLMIPHHQAAMDMAQAEILHGGDPQMRRLAQEIVTDQQSEIELMQLWLRRHTSDSVSAKKTPLPQARKD